MSKRIGLLNWSALISLGYNEDIQKNEKKKFSEVFF